MGKLAEERRLALKWGQIGLCWSARKGTFDAGIRRVTVFNLEKAGLLYQDGIFWRITPTGRRALSGREG